jgi:integrase
MAASSLAQKSQQPAIVENEKHIRLGKDGKYHVEIDRRRPDGRPFRKASKYTNLDKAIAARDEWLTLLEADMSPKKLTLDAWAAECFEDIMPFPHTRRTGLKPRTIHGYRLLYDLHASPLLGKCEVKSIRPEQMMQLLHKSLAHRDSDTQANMRTVLSKLYSLAQAMGKVPLGYNPVKLVTVPRAGAKYDDDGYEHHSVRNVSLEEQTRFLSYSLKSWAHLGFLIGFRMGLRSGEILGFNMRHVDWKNKLYAVRGQAIREPGKEIFCTDSLKKEGSYRSVPIPPSIFAELQKIKLAEPSRVYVFTFDGLKCFRRPEDFALEFKRAAKAAGLMKCRDTTGAPLKDPTPHDMRHSFGYLHANVWNTPHTALQKLLGHRNITTTLGYYAKASNEDVIAAMKHVA